MTSALTANWLGRWQLATVLPVGLVLSDTFLMISVYSFFQNGASVDDQLFGRMSGDPQGKRFIAVGAGPLGFTRVVAEAWIKA
jgi:hypothetical protein